MSIIENMKGKINMERKKLLKNCECEECKTPPTPPRRPICLELVDAKRDICSLINDISTKQGIPFYLLEIILADVFKQVTECAKAERENAKRVYEKELAEFNKKETGESNA